MQYSTYVLAVGFTRNIMYMADDFSDNLFCMCVTGKQTRLQPKLEVYNCEELLFNFLFAPCILPLILSIILKKNYSVLQQLELNRTSMQTNTKSFNAVTHKELSDTAQRPYVNYMMHFLGVLRLRSKSNVTVRYIGGRG